MKVTIDTSRMGLPLVRKIEKLAEAKKLSFADAVLFCLAGGSTRKTGLAIRRQRNSFSCRLGGSTRAKGA